MAIVKGKIIYDFSKKSQQIIVFGVASKLESSTVSVELF